MSSRKRTAPVFLLVLFSFIFLSGTSFAQPPHTPPPPPPAPSIPLKGEKVSFAAVGWNDDYWLMATTKGDLVRYDGREFTYITNLGSVRHI